MGLFADCLSVTSQAFTLGSAVYTPTRLQSSLELELHITHTHTQSLSKKQKFTFRFDTQGTFGARQTLFLVFWFSFERETSSLSSIVVAVTQSLRRKGSDFRSLKRERERAKQIKERAPDDKFKGKGCWSIEKEKCSEGPSQLRQRLSSVSDVDSMDKYRLVPNNLAPYLSQRNLMDYQYGTPFYDNNEGRPDQSGRPREQALAGDGFHYGGQHTMLPFEPIFTSDNVLTMVESELKKTALGYVQGLSLWS